MRKQNIPIKKKILKKFFLKICRIFGYEIIDQSNFYVPTQEKKLNENLNIQETFKLALKNQADYVAIGAFNTSKTKRTKYKANLNLLKKLKNITKTPIVAIGGINSINYKKLLLNKANFLAISGYIWKNKKLKPLDAIKRIVWK